MSQSVVSKIIFNIQTALWFFLAIGLLVVWLFLWATIDPAKARENRQKSKITLADAPLPTYIESYVQMTKEVPPIDFSTVIRDLRNYPPEFKDKKYFEKNAKRWTVQVMNVSSNEIITEYLNQRQDRDKFAYFRYHNANDELRYILTYEIMNNAQDALGAIKNVDFGLPSTAKLKAEEVGYYLKIMDQYERGDGIFGNHSDLMSVDLIPTNKEVPPTKSPSGQFRNGLDNKFQNAMPMPNTTIPNAQNNMTGMPTDAPKPSMSTQTNRATNRPMPQETEANQEVVIDMTIPKAPPKLVSQEPPPAVTYTKEDVVYEVPKPDTNTSSIPGADRE